MRNRKQITLVIITAAISSLLTYFACSPVAKYFGPPVPRGHDERISWDSAMILMKDYLEYEPLRVKHNGKDGNGKEQKQNLKGFIFSADALKEIIEGNHSAVDPDSVAFFFGREGKFNDGLLNKSANMHIIAVGIKDGKLLKGVRTPDSSSIRANAFFGASVFDKADPCPPFCPEEIENN